MKDTDARAKKAAYERRGQQPPSLLMNLSLAPLFSHAVVSHACRGVSLGATREAQQASAPLLSVLQRGAACCDGVQRVAVCILVFLSLSRLSDKYYDIKQDCSQPCVALGIKRFATLVTLMKT